MSKSLILILTGPSGSGKTTLSKYLVNKYNFVKPKTYTTRGPRSEENLDSYSFITKNEFITKINQGKMAEYVENCNNYYGSSVESFNLDKNIVISLDHRGAYSIRNMYPHRSIIVMLKISKEVMIDRINKRSVISDEQIKHRIKELEHGYNGTYDYIMEANANIEEVTRKIDEILCRDFKIQSHNYDQCYL